MKVDPAYPPRVHVDSAVLGGTPVFEGSRLPIVTFLACVDAGEPWARLVNSWPWLTEAHLQAAREWVASHSGTRVVPWLALGTPRRRRPLGQVLTDMPDVGEDEDFARSKD